MARAGLEPATFHFSCERYYQLSYLALRVLRPGSVALPCALMYARQLTDPATPTGLEPATSAVTGRRANQLRHGAWFAGRRPARKL